MYMNYLDLLIPIGLCASTYSCLSSGHATVENFSRWRDNNFSSDSQHKQWLFGLLRIGGCAIALNYAIGKN